MVMAGHPLFKNLGIGAGVSLLAGLTCVCVPLLLLLYKYGPVLRAKSKFTDVPPGMQHEVVGGEERRADAVEKA